MKRYRIKQISETEFVPQVCDDFWDIVFRNWAYLEYHEHYNTVYCWYFDLHQYKCIVDSVDKAKSVIEKYKEIMKESSRYPKYHKA
jgi:GTP1/Obg family GTP-binding protein